MPEPRVAVVAVANHFESGGERWEDLLGSTVKNLDQNGMEVKAARKMVWDAADAVEVVDQLLAFKPDLLVILHVTWVCDTIQYLFVNNIKCPVVLWAVPFMETFSLGCVQHFGSILWENHIHYKYVYGLPSDREIISKIKDLADTASIVGTLKKARIALIGPRQTWRVANSQDMTREEWDFSKAFGATIIHIEMDELIGAAEKCSSKEARNVLEDMRQKNRVGKVETSEERLLYAVKVYLGVKELFQRYGLAAAAAECYPLYGGLVNLPSSWLADEGLILDTEGDIGHTYLLAALYQMGKVGPAALGEIGHIDPKNNCMYIDHEGSSAHSLAESVSDVCIQDGGDGTMVGFPFKPLPIVTITDICGTGGNYRMLITKGSTREIDHKTWVEAGSKFLAMVKVDNVQTLFDAMLSEGVDHHLLIKEGNVTPQLDYLCELLKIKKINQ